MQPNRDKYLNGAKRIADRLLEQASTSAEGLFWHTLALDQNLTGRLQIHESLYAGNAGLTLFFIELQNLCPDQTYDEVVASSLSWLHHYCRNHPPINRGGFTGRTSVLYPFLRKAALSGDSIYLDQALSIAESCWDPKWQQWPERLNDLISGKAGVLLAFLHLHAATGAAWLEKPIQLLTRTLIAQAYAGPQGLYWDLRPQLIAGLCGLSHGAAGVGFVFLELGHYSGNALFFQLAELAFAYERYQFSKYDAWPDFRKNIYNKTIQIEFLDHFARKNFEFFTQPSTMNMWCHGSAGIGLARLRAWELTGKPEYREELERAIEITSGVEVESGASGHLLQFTSLCHGRTGNRDFLLQAGHLLEDASLLEAPYELGDAVVQHVAQGGTFACGYPTLSQSDTSLFMGDAGIGYFLARLSAPEKVPCILAPTLPKFTTAALSSGRALFSDLDQAEVGRLFLDHAFPQTTAIFDIASPASLHTWLSDSPEVLDKRSQFAEFVEAHCTRIPSRKCPEFEVVWQQEHARYKVLSETKSHILVFMRFLNHQETIDPLDLGDDAVLRGLWLRANPDLTMLSKPDASHTNSNGSTSVILPFALGGGVRELQSLTAQVLTGFQTPQLVETVLQSLLNKISISHSGELEEATTLVLNQIVYEIKHGYLICYP